MLMHQHTTLFGPEAEIDSDRVGMIDPNCRIAGVIKQSYQQASFLCEEYYSCAPELDITVRNYTDPGKPIEMVYPPGHLQHILFELFKNSMRAVVESKPENDLPDIEVSCSSNQKYAIGQIKQALSLCVFEKNSRGKNSR